jgi:insulysin
MIWDWDEEGVGEKEARDLIDGLKVDLGRAVVMAKASEHEKILGSVPWETEPRYGSKYRVERFDEELVKEVSHLCRS